MIALTFQKAIQDPRSYISNPYGNYYQLRPGVWNYHPGIDVLFQEGSIAHFPVKSVAWGEITYAQRVTTPGFEVWGNLIVSRSLLPDGQIVYCRYAHVENLLVKVGDLVHPGQHLADVGNAYGAYAYHLDFSISPTKVLALTPWDWPGTDLQRVYLNYTDPVRFVQEHSQMTGELETLEAAVNNSNAANADLNGAWVAYKASLTPTVPPSQEFSATVKESGTRVRALPTINSTILAALSMNEHIVVIDANVDADGHHWMKITAGPSVSVGGYVAKDLLSFP